jgi:hypothetical protein
VAVVVAAQQPEPPRFTTEASAVVLDVVVRDAHGRPVVGLTRHDFEVLEDRRRQTISVFEGPAARSVAPDARQPDAAPTDAARAPAASRLLDVLDRRDFAGIFAVDRSIQVLEDYGPPSPALGRAIDRATRRPGLPLRRAGIVPGAEFESSERGQPTQETRDESKRTRGMATLDALTQVIRGLALLSRDARWSCSSRKASRSMPRRRRSRSRGPTGRGRWTTPG